MDKKNFIKTNDPETADMLRKAGFIELPKEQNRFVFLNEVGKMDFTQGNTKVSFDNNLLF